MAFQWLHTNDYPPSLASIPPELRLAPEQIFNVSALTEAQLIAARNSKAPLHLAPVGCKTLKEVEEFVRKHHDEAKLGHMYEAPNIGLRDDWFTDAVFGQQTLTGTNPAVITRASTRWIDEFKAAATSPEARDLLTREPGSFFVVDYSYVHGALGIPPEISIPPRADPNSPRAFGGASVTLFRFEPDTGRMHPFAIILDYNAFGTDPNVFIFNRRLTSSSPSNGESTDWPWRYAKTVTQVANWLGHEVGVHLVEAHLVTEVCLIAAHIAFKDHQNHLVFQLLRAHRDVTFPVNSLARAVLVPRIIIPASGFPEVAVKKYLQSTFNSFDWKGSYVPASLRARGFPIDQLDQPKFKNCGWARGVAGMWGIIRAFVLSVLQTQYPGPTGDAQVAADPQIRALCGEVRGAQNGRLTSFPETITTLNDLVDAVTNIIHIATTQHTSVNYLQQYYMTFVPNFPGALYTPLPKTQADLAKVTEKELVAALPIAEAYKFDWLLMGQVPYLLSFAPPKEKSIFHYATETAGSSRAPPAIRAAAAALKTNLTAFSERVKRINDDMEQRHRPYLVLDPVATTSSIIL